MIRAAAVVLILLVVGEAVADRLALPIPGAALGLTSLAAGFAIRGGADEGSAALFDLLAPYFPLFFVPAAVGVLANLDVLTGAWVHLVFAIVVGTGVTIVVTGHAAQTLLRLQPAEAGP